MTHARSKRRLHDRRGRRPALTLLGFLALTTAWGPPAWGQGTSHSSWNCVPEQAVFAIRIPDGSDCIDALREQTKLGAVFFNDKRLEQFKTFLRNKDPDAWDDAVEEMGEYGFSPADFPAMLAGETGFALLLVEDEDEETAMPRFLGLTWVEPGEDMARRVIDAITKGIEEQNEEEESVIREDFELAGQSVMHLKMPVVEYDEVDFDFEWPDNFDEMTDEQRQEMMEEWQRRGEESVVETVNYINLLIARRDSRLLILNTFDPVEDEQSAVEVEHITGVFSRFIAAHEANAEDGGFVQAISSAPGVDEALPQQGLPLVELFADVSGLIALADMDPGAQQIIDAIGLASMNVIALRTNLDEAIAELGLFVSAPAPRSGILQLLDQPELQPIPPAWVPADVVSYSHLSYDLGKAYAIVKDLILKAVGDEAAMGFQMMEGTVWAQTQTELGSLLSSLGHQHMLLSYESTMPAFQGQPGVDVKIPSQRLALVWQLKDEAVWTRVFAAINQFAETGAAPFEATEEQGFSGWRIPQSPIDVGLFLGKGFLVFAMGGGVTETTLSAISHPPEGQDALRGSDVQTEAADLLELQPGLAYQITDGNRHMQSTVQLMKMIDGMSMDMPEEQVIMFDMFRALLPDEEEMDGVLGVSAGYTVVNDHGLVSKAKANLPAP